MLVRVQRIGTGVPSDPFRVPLPSYTMVFDDAVGGSHIVDVPASELPPGFDVAQAVLTNIPNVGNVVTGMPAGRMAGWLAHLQARYGQLYNPVVR